MTLHIGRSFAGNPLERECPCPLTPCGLVATNAVHPDCDQHTIAASKTLRQMHDLEHCPAKEYIG